MPFSFAFSRDLATSVGSGETKKFLDLIAYLGVLEIICLETTCPKLPQGLTVCKVLGNRFGRRVS